MDTGTWRSKFEQKTNSVLLTCWSKKWKSQRPRIYWLLCTTSRTIHAQSMEETSRRGILGRYWSCDQGRIGVLSNKIECNYSSRNTSSLLHSKSWKIENWRSSVWKTILVFSTTTKDLIETRSLKGMINRVLQLNNSQLENSFNSLLEKHFVLDLPNQPNPNPIQSVIERGNLWSKKTRPAHERSLVSCKKNLVLQIERGNLWSVKTIASWMFTIEPQTSWLNQEPSTLLWRTVVWKHDFETWRDQTKLLRGMSNGHILCATALAVVRPT